MAAPADIQEKKRPTKLFFSYAVRLTLRTLLFAAAILACIFDPSQLSFSQNFGLAGGLNLIDIIFVFLIADGLTKMFPSAKIAIGSLKQYERFHVPTRHLFEGGREELLSHVKNLIQQGKLALESLPEKVRKLWEETKDGTLDSLKVVLSDFGLMKKIPFKPAQLTAPDSPRRRIKRDRYREIYPVIIFWVIFNAAIAVILGVSGILNDQSIVLWVLFYFLFDMICVVLWCPLQVVFMKNRCCTTCQIFNWDAIMTATPLLLVVGSLASAWFVWPVLALSIIVLIRWELAFARHPERFDERTNASLSCAHCPDKLCFIREPLIAHIPEDHLTDRASGLK